MTEQPIVSLENLGRGAAVELFDDGLQKVLANINDLNTSAKTTRQVTLKVTIKPSENRDIAEVAIECVPKLAPVAPVGTRIAIGKTLSGKVEAREWNNPQADMFVGNEQSKVYKIGGGKE